VQYGDAMTRSRALRWTREPRWSLLEKLKLGPPRTSGYYASDFRPLRATSSRSLSAGPLGFLALLFTPTAMVIAQTVLITPIIVSLTRQVIEDLWHEYAEQLTSLGSSRFRAIPTLLWDARFSLVTTLLAGFGRATAEVGAVLIVGGNIAGHTRVMTTAIALETARGDLALALGLGIILLAITLALNAGAFFTGRIAQRAAGAG
jgi:tungstate transport system permease protein